MRTTLRAYVAGVFLVLLTCPAAAQVSPPPVSQPPVSQPPVSQPPAPLVVPDTMAEESPRPFRYSAVFLVPIVLGVGAAWAARAFTRTLTVSSDDPSSAG